MPVGKGKPGRKPKSDTLDSSKGSANSSYRGGRGSANSSYRDGSFHDTEDSSQDSSQLDDSQEDGNYDQTDNMSHLSRSRESSGNSPIKRHSPYSKSRKLLEEVENDFYSSELDSLHLSPMAAKLSPLTDLRARKQHSPGNTSYFSDHSPSGLRTASSPIASAASSPLTRPSLHLRESPRSPNYTPFKDGYESTRTSHGQNKEVNKDFISILLGLSSELKCGICSVLVILVLCVFFGMPAKNAVDDRILRSNLNDRDLMVQNFEKYFKTFMPMFPGQSDRMWLVLKAATKRVLREAEPGMPSVILIVGNKGAFDTVDCLAKRYAKIVAQVYSVKSPAIIDQSKIANYPNSEELKLYLDKTLHSALDNEKVVVVQNIEKISGQAAMIFHSYCDNEFAPFKDSLIILTMHIDNDKELTLDSEIENYLESKWENELDKDKRAALIYSRIGNNIAVVLKEGESNLKEVCG